MTRILPPEAITEYGRKAKRGDLPCMVTVCPRCAAPVGAGGFRRHGVRRRLFLMVVATLVEEVASYLVRWKCPVCGGTFTQYPWWAMPFKRYVLPFIEERCAGYVEDTAPTYAVGVKEQGAPFSHADADGGEELAPSTLWHWITTLGQRPEPVRAALDLIKQKDPSTGVFRALGALQIRVGKYRSPSRKKLLRQCRERVLVARRYRAVFGVETFPASATGCGFR